MYSSDPRIQIEVAHPDRAADVCFNANFHPFVPQILLQQIFSSSWTVPSYMQGQIAVMYIDAKVDADVIDGFIKLQTNLTSANLVIPVHLVIKRGLFKILRWFFFLVMNCHYAEPSLYFGPRDDLDFGTIVFDQPFKQLPIPLSSTAGDVNVTSLELKACSVSLSLMVCW